VVNYRKQSIWRRSGFVFGLSHSERLVKLNNRLTTWKTSVHQLRLRDWPQQRQKSARRAKASISNRGVKLTEQIGQRKTQSSLCLGNIGIGDGRRELLTPCMLLNLFYDWMHGDGRVA